MNATASADGIDGSQYESFYGLGRPPFALASDPRFLYPSASHDEAIRGILQAIRRQERFLVLSGDVGTGKTTLCRALLRRLDRTTRVSLVLNPFLSIEDLLRQVLMDIGAVPPDASRGEALSKTTLGELSAALAGFLDALEPGGRAVLILDEAQHLSPRVLEALRLMVGLERDGAPRLHVILVGQPALLEVLAAADLRQLDQRISLKTLLAPLDRADVGPYIEHRLTVAGESVSVAFDPAAVKRVHALTGGVPRAINLLCDRALMAGAARGVHDITPALVDAAAEALAFRRPDGTTRRTARRARRSWGAWTLAALVALLAGVLQAPLHRLVDLAPPALPAAPAVPLPPPLDLPGVPPE